MKRLIASCFGLGWLPIAPGTWGSLPPAVVFAAMVCLGVPGAWTTVAMAALAIAACVACVLCTPVVVVLAGKNDPGEVVVDEVAGQALVYLVIPLVLPAGLSTARSCLVAVLGFLLFRAFDIVKPWPARKVESLPRGWGVLADDLLAGVFAAVVLYVCVRFWIAA
jgi:phosphatidylglycerophosphatase A